MPLTLSGRSIKADNNDHPSLIDIAVGLSRQPRFGGQCRRWWSVLDHTLFGDELVQAERDVPPVGEDEVAARRLWRLAWLLHDAHESLTGDVPTPYKGDELRAIQKGLDVRIYRAYFSGGPAVASNVDLAWAIHDIDARCMRAEALFVGPPSAWDHQESFGITADNYKQANVDADLIRLRLGQGAYLGLPPVTYPLSPDAHAGVQEYLKRIMELISDSWGVV